MNETASKKKAERSAFLSVVGPQTGDGQSESVRELYERYEVEIKKTDRDRKNK